MTRPSQYRPTFADKDTDNVEDLPTNLPVINEEVDDMVSGVGGMLDELRNIGGEASLNVYVLPKPGANRTKQFLMNCGITDYSLGELLTLIQNGYGAGEYEVCGTVDGKIRARRRVSIGAALNKPEQVKVTLVEPVDPMRPMVEFLDKMLRQHTETMAGMLATVLTKLDRPAIDPMAIQRETLTTLASMRDVFAPPQVVTPTPTSSTFAQLKELLEIRSMLAGDASGAEDSNPLMDMAKQFLPALLAGAAKTPPLTSVQQTMPAVRPIQTKAPPHPVGDSPMMIKMIQDLQTLVKAARNNSDPDLYAELIVDQFDLPQIKSFLEAEDAIDRLALFSNDVKLYRPWFEKLRSVILQWIRDAEAEQDDSGPAAAITNDPNDGGTPGDTHG